MPKTLLQRDTGAIPQQAFVTVTKDFYAQDDDPGAVGAGSVWKQTSLGDPGGLWYTRNEDDDGWIPEVTIVVEGAVDEVAFAGTQATASGTGTATANNVATGVDGAASTNASAQTSGVGDAFARNDAVANGSGFAQSALTATAGAGDAQSFMEAYSSDPGGYAESYLLAGRGAGEASIHCKVTAAGLVQHIVTGLPSADPGVAGQLFTVGAPSAGVPKALMVSGG